MSTSALYVYAFHGSQNIVRIERSEALIQDHQITAARRVRYTNGCARHVRAASLYLPQPA
jgi:hypothetical protein